MSAVKRSCKLSEASQLNLIQSEVVGSAECIASPCTCSSNFFFCSGASFRFVHTQSYLQFVYYYFKEMGVTLN